MWENYRGVAAHYRKLSLAEERAIIVHAKAGKRSARDELVLRHIGFIMWRLSRKVYRQYLERHGDDLLSAAILTLYQKIRSYDLNYRDRGGALKPVRFKSYIWKRIDGLAIDHIKREIRAGVSFEEQRHGFAPNRHPE